MARKSFGCACGFGQSGMTVRMHREHAAKLQVGDRVRYSAMFLRSTGQYLGEVPQAKGVITGIDGLGSDTRIADVRWENCRVCAARVNAFNLWKVGKPEPD